MIFQVVPRRASLLILRRPLPLLTLSQQSAKTRTMGRPVTLPQSLRIRRLVVPLPVRSMLARRFRYPLMAVQLGLTRRLVQAHGARQVLLSPAAHGRSARALSTWQEMLWQGQRIPTHFRCQRHIRSSDKTLPSQQPMQTW